MVCHCKDSFSFIFKNASLCLCMCEEVITHVGLLKRDDGVDWWLRLQKRENYMVKKHICLGIMAILSELTGNGNTLGESKAGAGCILLGEIFDEPKTKRVDLL